jgi:hypothetical protein
MSKPKGLEPQGVSPSRGLIGSTGAAGRRRNHTPLEPDHPDGTTTTATPTTSECETSGQVHHQPPGTVQSSDSGEQLVSSARHLEHSRPW